MGPGGGGGELVLTDTELEFYKMKEGEREGILNRVLNTSEGKKVSGL